MLQDGWHSRVTLTLIVVLLSVVLPAAAWAQDGLWRSYTDPATGYRIDLPTGLLATDTADTGIIRMRDDDRETLLEVYAGTNPDGLSLDGFIDFLAESDRIAEVTYRTGGNTWFVLSGYYQRADAEPRSLIFYAKFMFSADLQRFAAFEISYPEALKRDLDPVVERLEASLRAPS